MASISELVEGLEILAKTAEVPAGLSENGETDTRTTLIGGAEHDIIYGPDCDPTLEDRERLEEIGWHFDEDADCWARFV